MINIFKKMVDPSPLLTSELFDEHFFYKEFSKDIRVAHKNILIESPYITLRRASEIAPLLDKAIRRGVQVSINTRNPYHHDGILVSESLKGIEVLRDIGVKITTCNDMRHRKLAMIDGYILWEGSLNLLSQNGSKEIMRRTVSRDMCLQMERFIKSR